MLGSLITLYIRRSVTIGIFAILSFCIFEDSKSQQRMPPLDFEQFRKDVAAAQSPEEKLNRYVEMSLRAMGRFRILGISDYP